MVAPDREYILIVIQDIIRRLLQADAAGHLGYILQQLELLFTKLVLSKGSTHLPQAPIPWVQAYAI